MGNRMQQPIRASVLGLIRLPLARVTSPWTPVAIYAPLGLGFWIWNSLDPGVAWWSLWTLPLAGLFVWTLFEYLLHRVAFHWPFASPRFRSWQNDIHLSHHDCPSDLSLIVSRIGFSLPFALGFALIFALLLGEVQRSCLLLVGLIAGYLWYEIFHYRIHQSSKKSALVRVMARNHMHHHFKNPGRCYGVTSPLWDYAFGTHDRAPTDKTT
jgi:sterol desaturase/sphingolipid hydroxylase (fatty acid hydroxylase superfamily)